jgi:hypothetical protein
MKPRNLTHLYIKLFLLEKTNNQLRNNIKTNQEAFTIEKDYYKKQLQAVRDKFTDYITPEQYQNLTSSIKTLESKLTVLIVDYQMQANLDNEVYKHTASITQTQTFIISRTK